MIEKCRITATTRSNDAYAWGAHVNVNRGYVSDGLNRIMSAGGQGFGYNARGNLTSDGTNAYSYTAENLLKSGPNGAVLSYDPLGRLAQTRGGGVVTRFGYDGIDLIAEHDAAGTLLRRYVHGPGIDNPIVWYEGAATSDRRFLMADERGSIVSITNSAGATIEINSYDEWGIPAPNNFGRFGYTGQLWIPELKLWYYKARMYSPTLGRFLQTDPIGYADGMNWYAYVGNDPVNHRDPSGTLGVCNFGHSGADVGCGGNVPDEIVSTAPRLRLDLPTANAFNVSIDFGPGIPTFSALAEQGGHYYETTERVCRVPLSKSERGQINRATAVPDGRIVPARSAGTHPVGGSLWGMISIPFWVTTRFSADWNIAVNTTTSAHLFVGTVTRTIYSNARGTFIRTVGSGNAGRGVVGEARDKANSAMGPTIFENSNGAARHFAKRINPSC